MTSLFLFLLGICIGSFLNVIAERVPNGVSVTHGRSHCDSCKHILAWYDLIPLISFFLLERKCRYCHTKLRWQYPLSEFTCGVLFVMIFWFAPLIKTDFVFFALSLIAYLFIVSCLFAIALADINYGIIPDQLVMSMLGIIIIYFLFAQINLLHMLFAALLTCAFFLLLFCVTKGRGIGFGDVKLSFVMGLLLGYPGIIIALYVAFLTGAAIALILVLCRKKKFFGSTIPFGPFLILGTYITLWFGSSLWQFLLHLLKLQ